MYMDAYFYLFGYLYRIYCELSSAVQCVGVGPIHMLTTNR